MLFLHGAGGFDEDRELAERLAAAAGTVLQYPELSSDDMSVAAWVAMINAALDERDSDEPVVAHSFGASMLLRALVERPDAASRAVLLALPNWSPAGWDVDEYAFTGPPPATPVELHHCRDDEVVEFAHLALNRAALPTATVHEYDTGGHQFDGLANAIARDI